VSVADASVRRYDQGGQVGLLTGRWARPSAAAV